MSLADKSLVLCVISCIAGLASPSGPLRAEEKESSSSGKPKLEGFIRSIVEAGPSESENFHEGRVTIKTPRKSGFRAELEFEVETKEDTLEVLEVVLDKKLEDQLRWEFGYTQKRMGVEYEENRLERSLINRTLIYRRLEAFNYVGRESVFRLRSDSGDFSDWALSAGVSESQNASLVYNWQTPIESLDARYGFWLFGGSDKTDEHAQPVYAMTHSLWHRSGASRWQLEWMTGLDPQQTEFELVYGDKEKVYFTGINGLLDREVWSGGEGSVRLQFASTVLLHDHRQSNYNSIGGLLGARYLVGALRLSLNAEVIGTNSPLKPEKRTYDESMASVELLYEI